MASISSSRISECTSKCLNQQNTVEVMLCNFWGYIINWNMASTWPSWGTWNPLPTRGSLATCATHGHPSQQAAPIATKHITDDFTPCLYVFWRRPRYWRETSHPWAAPWLNSWPTENYEAIHNHCSFRSLCFWVIHHRARETTVVLDRVNCNETGTPWGRHM